MNADTIKTALRSRHHAAGGTGVMVGEWTCLEELWGIDLLAWSAWGKTARVGYEVKVSRSDYRRELLQPDKRANAVGLCDEFYFAVPAGLLTKDELAYREPGDLRPGDFERVPCPGFDMGGPRRYRRQMGLAGIEDSDDPGTPIYGGRCRKLRREYAESNERANGFAGKHVVVVPRPVVFEARDERTKLVGPDEYAVRVNTHTGGVVHIVCPTCGGRGYTAKSRVEQEAPTLWVPADVGLVTVYDSGNTRVVRKAPRRTTPRRELGPREVATAIRWASVRPDPRHVHDAYVARLVNDDTAAA